MAHATCNREFTKTLKDAFALDQGASPHSIQVHGLAIIFAPCFYKLLMALRAVIVSHRVRTVRGSLSSLALWISASGR